MTGSLQNKCKLGEEKRRERGHQLRGKVRCASSLPVRTAGGRPGGPRGGRRAAVPLGSVGSRLWSGAGAWESCPGTILQELRRQPQGRGKASRFSGSCRYLEAPNQLCAVNGPKSCSAHGDKTCEELSESDCKWNSWPRGTGEEASTETPNRLKNLLRDSPLGAVCHRRGSRASRASWLQSPQERAS